MPRGAIVAHGCSETAANTGQRAAGCSARRPRHVLQHCREAMPAGHRLPALSWASPAVWLRKRSLTRHEPSGGAVRRGGAARKRNLVTLEPLGRTWSQLPKLAKPREAVRRAAGWMCGGLQGDLAVTRSAVAAAAAAAKPRRCREHAALETAAQTRGWCQRRKLLRAPFDRPPPHPGCQQP